LLNAREVGKMYNKVMSTFPAPTASNRCKEVVRMTNRNMLKLVMIICGVLLVANISPAAYAQGPSETKGVGSPEGVRGHQWRVALVIFETLPEEEKRSLLELKETDPEKAREVISQRVKEQGGYLKQLRETDPQEFEAITSQAHQAVRLRHAARKLVFESFSETEKEAFKQLHEADPKKAREFIEEKVRERLEYLKGLKETDPEKFKEVAQKLYHKGQMRQMVTREVIFEVLSDEEKNNLVKLKAEDPQKFKAVIEQTLKEKGQYLKDLRESDPEEFKEVVRNAQQRIRERMETLREKDPEKFEEIITRARNRRRQHLEALCKEDPEKCKELKEQRLQRIRDMLRDLKEEDPESYEKIIRWLRSREDHNS
jgi:hypothetical protein